MHPQQHYHAHSHPPQQQQLQMQQLQQQRAMLDPATAAAAAAHHLHLHQQQQQHAGGHAHPAQTMTINRKLHGAAGVPGAHPTLPPVYGDDTPPPLPPLRNPQKALLPQPVATVAGSDACTTDPGAGTDKQIYIYSTAKYGRYDPNGKTASQQQPQQPQQPHPAPGKGVEGGPADKGSAGGKNPNTTTFSSTPGYSSKPLPSIINCPLPDIPKGVAGAAPTSKDDIYVKRKLLTDHPNGSKFATLKPIPAPKIEPNGLNGKHTGADLAAQQLPPPPPPPLPLPVTGGSSGSSGGSSSGYGTAGLTTSQIQSLPLPPPPLELQSDPDDPGLRLPPPPTSEELLESGAAGQPNGDGVPNGADTSALADKPGHDENSFYAVTEL
uniref:Protein tweety homolog n=1 Tax=Anopheles quadriannulatus TaxID=34691 RepID=A0A182WZ92_ANOQN